MSVFPTKKLIQWNSKSEFLRMCVAGMIVLLKMCKQILNTVSKAKEWEQSHTNTGEQTEGFNSTRNNDIVILAWVRQCGWHNKDTGMNETEILRIDSFKCQ